MNPGIIGSISYPSIRLDVVFIDRHLISYLSIVSCSAIFAPYTFQRRVDPVSYTFPLALDRPFGAMTIFVLSHTYLLLISVPVVSYERSVVTYVLYKKGVIGKSSFIHQDAFVRCFDEFDVLLVSLRYDSLMTKYSFSEI